MKNKNQSGQTIVENLVSIIILLLCSFFIIEISRLYAFKSYLNVIATDIVRKISFSHLTLIRDGIILENNKNDYLLKKFENNIKREIEEKLNIFQSSLFSFDKIDVMNGQEILFIEKHNVAIYIDLLQNSKSNKYPSGVYLKINACLPVLFSGYFRKFSNNNNSFYEVGKSVNINNLESKKNIKNCLGLYSSSNIFAPLFWFRVRAASYFPWPASTSIYKKGYSIPENILGIENKYRENVFFTLDNSDLSLFFKGKDEEIKFENKFYK